MLVRFRKEIGHTWNHAQTENSACGSGLNASPQMDDATRKLATLSLKDCWVIGKEDFGWAIEFQGPSAVLAEEDRCALPAVAEPLPAAYRAIKRRVNASQGFRSFHGARRTIQGYEAVHMIRKGQVRWLPKGDVLGLLLFVNEILGLRAE